MHSQTFTTDKTADNQRRKNTFGPSTDFFELLDLGLFKHGEHVGAGSVSSPLLGFLGGLQGF